MRQRIEGALEMRQRLRVVVGVVEPDLSRRREEPAALAGVLLELNLGLEDLERHVPLLPAQRFTAHFGQGGPAGRIGSDRVAPAGQGSAGGIAALGVDAAQAMEQAAALGRIVLEIRRLEPPFVERHQFAPVARDESRLLEFLEGAAVAGVEVEALPVRILDRRQEFS